MSVVGELPPEVRQALVSWDGASVAEQDFAQRVGLGLPPHRRAVRLDGPSDAIDEAANALGGLQVDLMRDSQGAFVLASRGVMPAVARILREVVVARSLRSTAPLYVKIDATPGA
jgi:primosomal protein N' (replication factor Y)